MDHKADFEKDPVQHDIRDFDSEENAVRVGSLAEVSHTRNIQSSFVLLRKLNEGEQWLSSRLGGNVETQGIDRVPEEAKNPPSIWNIFFIWFSLNVHVGVVPLGMLGPQIGLSLHSTIAAMMVGNILGALCTAFTGTLSPKLGLRQIATSRYSFGFWGAKLCSILNVLVGGGYAVVNLVAAGSILSAVSDYNMTISVGIVIVGVVSYLVSVFGYRLVLAFETYFWMVAFILFCVMFAQAAPHVDASLPSSDTGLAYAGAFLTILSINFSNASGWCSIAGDYYVHYRKETPTWKIMALSFFGIVVPLAFTITLGACIANAVFTVKYGPYAEAYDQHQFGGLLREIYHPLGFSKFALVLLAFSVLGNNIAICYSTGLSLQLLGHWFHAIPRMIWSFLVAVVITVLAIAGKDNLSADIGNFVSLLGYWTISFTLILLIEDRFFRRNNGYDVLVWDKPSKLPIGAAAVFALLCGYLGGGVPGMAQLDYVGPIAAKFGEDGGDVGIYLSGAITLLVYPVARTVERQIFGR